MCKLMIIPSTDQTKQKQTWELATAITPYLVENDKDGFGYMAITDKGLSGERWLDVNGSWIEREAPKQVADLLGDAVLTSDVYASFGQTGMHLHALALHSRMATCGVSMSNTHPHVSPDLSVGIVHNGVISNAADFGMKYSTCDSEAFLSMYEDKTLDFAHDPNEIAVTSEYIEGWYAVASFFKNKDGRWMVDVMRDNRAPLHAAYVKEINSVVLVTKPEHLDNALTDLGWSAVNYTKMRDCTLVRIDPLTGKRVTTIKLAAPRVKSYLPPVAHGWTDSMADRYADDYDVPAYREDYSAVQAALLTKKTAQEPTKEIEEIDDDAPSYLTKFKMRVG